MDKKTIIIVAAAASVVTGAAVGYYIYKKRVKQAYLEAEDRKDLEDHLNREEIRNMMFPKETQEYQDHVVEYITKDESLLDPDSPDEDTEWDMPMEDTDDESDISEDNTMEEPDLPNNTDEDGNDILDAESEDEDYVHPEEMEEEVIHSDEGKPARDTQFSEFNCGKPYLQRMSSQEFNTTQGLTVDLVYHVDDSVLAELRNHIPVPKPEDLVGSTILDLMDDDEITEAYIYNEQSKIKYRVTVSHDDFYKVKAKTPKKRTPKPRSEDDD